MKRIFTFTMALVVLLFAACEPEGGTTPTNSKLTRTSEAIMEFNAEGGNGEITFTLENPANGVQVIARCDAEWIDNLTTGDNVTFTVLENTTGESRLASIKVTYGDDCQFEVTVNQKASNGSTGGNNGENSGGNWYCYCDYFGTAYTVVPNYYITLSSLPMDEDGYIPEDAEAYCFDLYSNAAVGSTIIVPNGTYNYDANDTAAANTLGNYYSCYFPANASAQYFTAGTVTISDNKLVANVTTEDGKAHNVSYEGSLVCEDLSDYTEEDGGDTGNDDTYYTYSNLTDDYSFSVSGGNAYGYADFYGDYYDLGANNFYIDLYEDSESGSGLNITLDLLADATATDFVGTYTPNYTSASDTYTFIEGYINEDDYLVGSWIVTLENEAITGNSMYAPLTLGSVTIAATSTENVYTVTLDCTDDLGYNISGTFTSEFEITDTTTESVSLAPQKVQKKAAAIAPKAVKKVCKKYRIARR